MLRLQVENVIGLCGGAHLQVRDLSQIRYLMVHRWGWHDAELFREHGVEPTLVGCAKFYETNPEARAASGGVLPYPFGVGFHGTIWQGRDFADVAPHAWRWNVPALGVMCVGDFTYLPPTGQQWAAAVDLCAALVRFWRSSPYLKPLQIVGHDEVAGARKNPDKKCPGPLFDMAQFRADVEAVNETIAGQELVRAGIQF